MALRKIPPHLVAEHNRTNPNRLNEGVMSVADDKDNKVEAIKREPNKILKGLKIAGLVLSLAAGTLIAAGASGVPLPPLVISIAKVVLEIGKEATKAPLDQPAPVEDLK